MPPATTAHINTFRWLNVVSIKLAETVIIINKDVNNDVNANSNMLADATTNRLTNSRRYSTHRGTSRLLKTTVVNTTNTGSHTRVNQAFKIENKRKKHCLHRDIPSATAPVASPSHY